MCKDLKQLSRGRQGGMVREGKGWGRGEGIGGEGSQEREETGGKETGEGLKQSTSGYATMVHGRGCNPHRCTTTFANVEITSL